MLKVLDVHSVNQLGQETADTLCAYVRLSGSCAITKRAYRQDAELDTT